MSVILEHRALHHVLNKTYGTCFPPLAIYQFITESHGLDRIQIWW